MGLEINATYSPNTVREKIFKYICSCKGGIQGCPIATNMSCLPYFISLNVTQKRCPTLRIVSQAADTYFGDAGATLYEDFEKQRVDTRQNCELESNMDKVVAFSAEGDMAYAPKEFKGSPRHPNGRVLGFKAVGAFICGQSSESIEWAKTQLIATFKKKLANLEALDGLTDNETHHNVAHLQYKLLSGIATNIPNYWMRTMPPEITEPCVLWADNLVRGSFERLTRAAHSDAAIRGMAWEQAQLPTCLSGAGVGGKSRVGDRLCLQHGCHVSPHRRRGNRCSPGGGHDRLLDTVCQNR